MQIPSALPAALAAGLVLVAPWGVPTSSSSRAAAQELPEAGSDRALLAPITVTFRDTPLAEVAGTFADFAGRSIVVGPEAAGVLVTAEIRGQPWDLALREILVAHGLDAVETESGILRVLSPDRVASVEEIEAPVTRIFRIRWQDAVELEPVVASLLGDRGTVRAVPSTNALVVTDVPGRVARVAVILGHAP